jgi:hypothetical protein
MITTHLAMGNARLAISKSIVFAPRIRRRSFLNTTTKQHYNILLHGGMIEIIPQFFAAIDKGM